MGFGWDDILLNELQELWKENILEMDTLRQLLLIPRAIRPENAIGEPEVHGFSDSGDLAYGAMIFLRW